MEEEEKDRQKDSEVEGEPVVDSTAETVDDIVLEEEGEQPTDTIKRLREKLKECTAKKQEYLQGWQRAKADIANAKRDFKRERKQTKTRAVEEVMTDILPVLDSFEMAFSNKELWQQVDEQWRSGVERIHSQLTKSLSKHGLKAIQPDVGDEFSSELHNSVDTEETSDPTKNHQIAKLEKTGYKLDDRVIRSADVVVYKIVQDNGEKKD